MKRNVETLKIKTLTNMTTTIGVRTTPMKCPVKNSSKSLFKPAIKITLKMIKMKTWQATSVTRIIMAWNINN